MCISTDTDPILAPLGIHSLFTNLHVVLMSVVHTDSEPAKCSVLDLRASARAVTLC